MNKTLLLLLLSAFLLPAVSAPVRSNMGGDEVYRIEDDEPINLWVWPTEKTQIGKSPTSVWTPLVGVWYDGASNTGYFKTSGPYCEFGDDWVKIKSTSYSQGCFLYLNAGDYDFSCLTDTSSNGLSFAFYRAESAGYKYSHRVSYYGQSEWRKIISVPEECPLVFILFNPTNSDRSMTVTNIEIYRID